MSDAVQPLNENEARYRTLFNSMDEGFCIIQFIDGPHGPLSDYVHVEANAAYAANTGIPDVVGQKVRDMVPGEGGVCGNRRPGPGRHGVRHGSDDQAIRDRRSGPRVKRLLES